MRPPEDGELLWLLKISRFSGVMEVPFLQHIQAGPRHLHAGNQPPPETAVSSVSCVPICATLLDIRSKIAA